MKKHVPLGWRKHDPRRYRFALPNAVWGYQLKPKALTVLCYLSSRSTALTVKEIADGVHLSEAVVKKNLVTLRRAGLVNADNRLLIEVRDMRGEYFTLPNEVFLLGLSPGALSVYAYLLSREDRRTHKCHPSYKTICQHTRMAVATAEKCVAELVERGLVNVERTTYFRGDLKRTGNNLYTILPVHGAVEQHEQKQLRQLELDTARWNAAKAG